MANRKVKVIQITGEMRNTNGVRQSDLAKRIEDAIQGLYNAGLDNIDIRPEIKWETAATGGNALLIVTYDGKAEQQGKDKK